MKDLIKLIKITSEFNRHPNNLAKEYLIKSDDTYLTLGINCFWNSSHGYHEYVDKKWVKISDYVLGYGINLTNIILLFEKKGCEILNINRKVYNDYRQNCFIITYKKDDHTYKGFEYKDTGSLEDFYYTDACQLLLELYREEIKEYDGEK